MLRSLPDKQKILDKMLRLCQIERQTDTLSELVLDGRLEFMLS